MYTTVFAVQTASHLSNKIYETIVNITRKDEKITTIVI